MTIPKDFAAQVTEYIELSDNLLTKQAEENAALKAENEQLKNTQKQAAGEVSQPVLDNEKVAATVDNLIRAGLAKEGERKDLVQQLQQPAKVLAALDKVASLQIKTAGTLPVMGKVASTGKASTKPQRESDAVFEQHFS